MMNKSQPLIVLAIVVIAIILAVGAFMAISFFQKRPESPAGTFTVNVEGEEITVKTDPNKEVRIVGIEQPPALTAAEGIAATEIAPPAQVQQDQVELVQAATVVPPTDTPIPTATPVPEAVIFEPYTVQPNDTLYNIARRPDTSIALMARYGLSQDDLVTPGAVIQLPVGNPAYCTGNLQPYAVGEGDTAFSIGRRFNVTAEELKAINNLDDSYTVYGATIVCVPR